MNDTVLLSISEGVAEIRFNRPEVLNALNMDLGRAFVSAVDQTLANPFVRAVVISGEGPAFMAGGDLGLFRDAGREERPEICRLLIPPIQDAILRLAESPLPTIACINGATAGAGVSFALMTDLAVAGQSARFNLSYVKVGANPDCGGSHALVRILGLRKAMEIALLSETIDATEALRLGLVNKLVPDSELRAETAAIARRLATSAPLALASTKALLRRAATSSLADQLQAEYEGFTRLSGSEDFGQAVDAFFAKRKPVFFGR